MKLSTWLRGPVPTRDPFIRLLFWMAIFVAVVAGACSYLRAAVNSPTTWVQYTLTSNPQTLTVPFVFQFSPDLLVLDSKTSPPTTLTLNSDYSVSGGAGSTGTITTIPGGANGVQVNDVITISRSVPLTQTTSFTNTGPLTASMIGQALDKITMLEQQINLLAQNSLQFPGDEITSGLLSKTARESMLLGFNSSGGIEYYAPGGGGGGGGGTVTSFSAALTTAAANVLTSSVLTPTTTPALTIGLVSAQPNTMLGNNTNVLAAPNYYTISSYLDAAFGSTQGGILYRGASGWSFLPYGTLGQFLETQGIGLNPIWAVPAGGGTLVPSGSITNGFTAQWNSGTSLIAVANTGSGSYVLANSPTLTGTPSAPTATTGANTTQIATTAFVNASIAAAGINVNPQTGSYTLQLTDNNGLIYHASGGAVSWVIPANSGVAFPVNDVVSFFNDATGGGTITVSITTDTLIQAGGTGVITSFSLPVSHSATIVKVATTRWLLNLN